MTLCKNVEAELALYDSFDLQEVRLLRRSPLPDPRQNNNEINPSEHPNQESFFGRRRRRQPIPAEDEEEIADMNDIDGEEEGEQHNPTQHMPDYMTLMQKAITSAAKYNDPREYFGVKPMKWVTRAEASISREYDAIGQELAYYANKARTHPEVDRRRRAVVKGNLWRGLAILAREQDMQDLIDTTDQRYEMEKHRLSEELHAMYQQRVSRELLQSVQEEYQSVCSMLEQWYNATAYQASINVQLELHKFQRAWHDLNGEDVTPLNDDKMREYAANAIAWKIKARQLANSE